MKRDITDTHKGSRHKGADHTAPYPVSRMAPAIELVDLAKEIAAADNMLTNLAHGKLMVIADQMRALQDEARTILDQTKRDQRLHRAQCNFKRIPGRTYHLYRRPDGSDYFSMLSPEEWRGKPPHPYQGSFRLENDLSWTPAEEIGPSDETGAFIERLLES